jgi:hypothetical protein
MTRIITFILKNGASSLRYLVIWYPYMVFPIIILLWVYYPDTINNLSEWKKFLIRPAIELACIGHILMYNNVNKHKRLQILNLKPTIRELMHNILVLILMILTRIVLLMIGVDHYNLCLYLIVLWSARQIIRSIWLCWYKPATNILFKDINVGKYTLFLLNSIITYLIVNTWFLPLMNWSDIWYLLSISYC